MEGRLASLGGGCRLKCGGEEDQAIAYLITGVEVDLAQQPQQVVVEEVVEAEAGSSVLSLMKESTLDQHCRWIRIGGEIPEGAQELHCGRSLGVPQSLMKVDANRRMVFGLATPAYFAPGSCCLGSSFACCMANPGYRPMPSGLPCGGICLVAWRIHRDVRGCPGPVQV